MTDQDFSALVIGSDGIVGSMLYDKLVSSGVTAYGTTRHHRENQKSIVFDLLGSFDEVLGIARVVNTAFLCAGITNIEACESDVARSEQINVTQTVRLAEALCRQRVFVVFLSSDAVFSGDTPIQRSSQVYSPKTSYGRQKVAAERQLRMLETDVAIVRMTKVLSRQTPLIREWVAKLARREVIHPFYDLYFSPVSSNFAADVLVGIGRLRRGGVYQISGKCDLSYADFGRLLAEQYCGANDMMHPISFATLGTLSRFSSRYSSLDMHETKAAVGAGPQSPKEVVHDLLCSARGALGLCAV